MRATSKKVFNEYTKEITTILINNGFEQSNNDCIYKWSKLTRYGMLFVKLDSEPPANILSIWQRFDDLTKAKDIIKLTTGGQYSGKCNIHETSLRELIYEFNRFLILIS